MIESVLSKYFTVYTQKDILEKYSMDYGSLSPILSSLRKIPKAVIKIKEEEEIKILMDLVNEYNFPVIPRGNGTNTLGEAIPLNENSVIVDMSELKGFEDKVTSIIVRPGTEFNEIGIEKLPVVPTSFNMATIGGYVAGGSLGFGSLKYGAIWDNVRQVVVYTPKGRYTLEGEDTYSVVQAAGTTGIISQIKIAALNRPRRISVIRAGFNTLRKAIDKALDLLEVAEFISIRNKAMASIIEPYHKWDKWNLIYGINDPDEEEDLPFKDIVTTFAGAYFTVVNRTKVNYASMDISLDELEKIDDVKCLIDAELAKSRGKYFSHTYFLGYTSLPNLKSSKFDLHSFRVNDRVEPDRLKKMVSFKRVVDPEDLLNPGKLVMNT
ncbi:FAD binding domain-containing protein [Stygiolobus caldivivus]|uniref:FAD binding domain-containing protein n=2 Tax=Stygiolobus caldivivus TaxID=2824673 RepID=A0A8D5U8Y6_9CREN|nr:FAD binding domain-containing protein [Stygiolobus caldivivus]